VFFSPLVGARVVRSATVVILVAPAVGTTHATTLVFLVNGIGEGAAAKPGIKLALHEGAEIVPGTTRSHDTNLVIHDPPGVIGGDAVRAHPIEKLLNRQIGYALLPGFGSGHGKLGRRENAVQPVLRGGSWGENQVGKHEQLHGTSGLVGDRIYPTERLDRFWMRLGADRPLLDGWETKQTAPARNPCQAHRGSILHWSHVTDDHRQAAKSRCRIATPGRRRI
jgi:hypothetical protein